MLPSDKCFKNGCNVNNSNDDVLNEAFKAY